MALLSAPMTDEQAGSGAIPELSPVETLLLHEACEADTVALAYGMTASYLGSPTQEELWEQA